MGFPDWALKVASEKIDLAHELNIQAITSSCPFCKTNLVDAAKNKDLQVLDIVEILATTVKP